MTELEAWQALLEALDKRYVRRDEVEDVVDDAVDEALDEVFEIAEAEAAA